MPFVMGYRGQQVMQNKFAINPINNVVRFPIRLMDWEINTAQQALRISAPWEVMTLGEQKAVAMLILRYRDDSLSQAQLSALSLNVPLANSFEVIRGSGLPV